MISRLTGSPVRAEVTLSRVRSAFATLPLRPMTLPMSDSATCSSMMVPSSPLTTSTLTASGSSTSDLATYSTRSAAAIVRPLLGGQAGDDAGLLEEPANRVRRLGALGEPILGLRLVHAERDGIGPGVVVPD